MERTNDINDLMDEQFDNSGVDRNSADMINKGDTKPAAVISDRECAENGGRINASASQVLECVEPFVAMGQTHDPKTDSLDIFENILQHYLNSLCTVVTRNENDIGRMFERLMSDVRSDVVKQNNVINQHSNGLVELKELHEREIELLQQQNDEILSINESNTKEINKMVDVCNDLMGKIKPLTEQNLAMKEQISDFFKTHR